MKPPRTTGTLLSRGLISRSYLQSQHQHRQRLPCRDSTSISSSRQRSLTHLHLSPTPTPHHAEIDFTSSHPASHGSPQDTNERTIKLGRSTSSCGFPLCDPSYARPANLFRQPSTPNTSISPSDSPPPPSSDPHPQPDDKPPSLPLHTSASSPRLRSRRLPCCAVDLAPGMG